MNNIYDAARYKLMNALFSWTEADLMLTAWSGVPTFDPTNTLLSNITDLGGTDRGSSLTITSKTVNSQGVGQTNQVVIPAVAVGPDITFFTLSDRHPTYIQSELILFLDEVDGLPFVANGLDMLIQPDWLTFRGWFKP
jgi:hypothetical protein